MSAGSMLVSKAQSDAVEGQRNTARSTLIT